VAVMLADIGQNQLVAPYPRVAFPRVQPIIRFGERSRSTILTGSLSSNTTGFGVCATSSKAVAVSFRATATR